MLADGYKDTEIGVIPIEWDVVKFRDITKVRQGLQIPISKRKTEPCENCYQYITIQFVKNNKEIEYIQNPQQSVICVEDDVLMTRTGNTGIVITNVNGVFHNNFFLIDFDRTKISKDFLVFYLKSYSTQKEILLKACATTIPDLNHGDFYSINFVNPPLKEQEKIADILSTADEKIDAIASQIEKAETLKKGLLQKLLSEGIGHSEFKDSELGKIPESWEVVKFSDITKVRQGLQIPISKRKTEPCENCYQYITIQFVKNNKEIEYIENPQQSVICVEDDILMTRTGNTGIVITNVNGVFHNNFFLIDFDRTKISKDFLVFYLKSYQTQKEILLKACATTIPDLNHGDFYSIKFLYPPLKEQKQIAEILSTADEKVEVLKAKKEKYKTLKKGLLQKLLSGEVRV